MAELAALLQAEIPEGRNNLTDSFTNLERVAEYCEANYFQSDNKRIALESTKNYTTQSLASVAYQINTLAYNFLQLLDLQTVQLNEMESQMNHISQTVMIHKEKVARREIGVLTANKVTNRQYKIIAPANPEKPIKYVRKGIDYTALDEIGHGVRWGGTPRASSRGGGGGRTGTGSGVAGLTTSAPLPAPTTKPPTPPAARAAVPATGTLGRGTLGKASREYRALPVVAPPQVPSHYAPNYPVGHGTTRRAPGYSTLPQIGMVHPTQHSQPIYNQQDAHATMPPPPSPLIGSDSDHNHSMMNSGQRVSSSSTVATSAAGSVRGGSTSPPLPPPPPSDEDERHQAFGRPQLHHQSGSGQHFSMPAIVPDEEDLPGWVPKNYIEKVVAIYDYYADKEDELSFQENAVLYVLKKNDDGWWEGVMDGITGLFPGNYVEPCV